VRQANVPVALSVCALNSMVIFLQVHKQGAASLLSQAQNRLLTAF
jgi:hypothetical protein